MRVLRLANAQREEIAERIASFANRGKLRGEENLAADLARKPVFFHFEDHFDHVVVGIEEFFLLETAAFDPSLLHELLHRFEFGGVATCQHRIREDRRGSLQGNGNKVVIFVRWKLRIP